jgi:hypothetical protein
MGNLSTVKEADYEKILYHSLPLPTVFISISRKILLSIFFDHIDKSRMNNRIYCLFIDFDNCLKRKVDVVEPHLVCLIVVYYYIPLIERLLLPIGNESR